MSSPIRVLMVDDSPYFLEAAQDFLLLHEMIHLIGVARHGEEALTQSRELLPDVILLDLNLNSQSGLDLILSLKKHAPRIKVIILSMMDEETYKPASLHAGADAFVHKTTMSQKLIPAILDTVKNGMEETTTPTLQKDYFIRLAKHTQDLIYRYEFTPRRGFVYVSPSATAMTGYTPAEHYADPDLGFNLVHPDDRHLLEKISFDGDILHAPIVLRWIRKDGSMLWTEQRNVPIYDEHQNVIAIEGIARDVTSRKQIEENLRLESAALEFAANAVVITDRDGMIQWTNSAFAKLTGYSAEESLGRNPRDLVRSGMQDEAFYQDMWTTILGGQVWRGELINRHKDGTYYTEEQSIAPVVNAEGVITHFVGIKQDVSERKRAEEELRQKNNELLMAYDTVIEGWSRAMDLRDKETEDHTMRVTALTLNLARHMNMPENELIDIKRGALLHDIGKLGVPDNILLKPGKLTDEEWRVMRQHPVLAHQMLASIEFLKPALDIPYCHHEKWDGTGYPCGLKGEEIPLAARIFAVADVWDALTSDRPYRSAWTYDKTLQFVMSESGRHFDPNIVENFVEIISTTHTQ